MPAYPVDLGQALDDLIGHLVAAGVRSVTADPSELHLPGILVQISGVSLDNLAGYTVRTRLLCVAPDRAPRRVLEDLTDLFNAVTEVVDPTADTTTETVNLPADATPYPALAIPFDLPVIP